MVVPSEGGVAGVRSRDSPTGASVGKGRRRRNRADVRMSGRGLFPRDESTLCASRRPEVAYAFRCREVRQGPPPGRCSYWVRR